MTVNSSTFTDLSLDWDEAFGGAASEVSHTDSISDALILSLSNLGRVDIEYIISVTGEDYNTVISALKGSIYQNPETWGEDIYKGWETAEEYLSGNLRRKIRSARNANSKYPGRFSENIIAIRKFIPEMVDSRDIYVTLGSPWVPTDVIEEFIAHILKMNIKKRANVMHDEYTSSWEISEKSAFAYMYSVAARNTFGTPRMDALEILEKTLNMKTVAIYDEVDSHITRSGKKRVINQAETLLALEKQQKMISEFKSWVWKDSKRRELLEYIFENKYSSVRRRIFDGSFLKFPGLSEKIELYPYQKNAIARILFSPNTLLAHEVGSGKTYVMIVAGMELKRMGLSKKNLYVVPNNIVMQWRAFFEAMYPKSKVFTVEAKNFTPEKRSATLKAVRDGDFDAIIMAYSCFDRIPLSKDFLIDELKDAKDEIKAIEENSKHQTSGLKRKKEQLNREMMELYAKIEKSDDVIYFDELGITRLFVDEAHNYKNVPIETKTDRVLGISAGGSQKCSDMLDKVHYIQKTNNGGGVVMATGTPITNSLTDAFVMQKYLQSGELAMLDLQTFDSWIGMFAERVTEFEVDVDTSSYRLATRFSKFHNLPELTSMFASIADFHQVGESVYLPAFDGYSDNLIPKTKEFSEYLAGISERAENVRSGRVRRKDDNMLKITTDGRKAALDLRLVDDKSIYVSNSKIAKCVDNVHEIYMKTKNARSAQLVFCDTSTPKEGFNVYDELKYNLILRGVPESEIAYVHDANTEAQREKLFKKVREGDIRILIGSTFKLGMGVNVQNKLVAIHHLDIPWRPADMTQREGRILRQGNENEKVYIYRYITEGSFDAYSWQLLETKQRFISELLAGSLTARSGSDVDSVVLNYAEVKALAIGNPLVKERVETANELTRLSALHRRAIETHIKLEEALLEMPAKIERQEGIVTRCRADVRWYLSNRREYSKEERRDLRERLAEAIKRHAEEPVSEVVAMNYQGFDVVLPINMSAERPYIWLKRESKYFIELGGESGLGAIIRIDNFLDRIVEHLQKISKELNGLKDKETALREELLKKDDYAERIEALREKIEKLDRKLGVTKDE